ncbi:MAG: B12-binding domain-containing radical SAM protein, partial [Candidatus Omnitrophota bacterium]
FHNWRLSFIEGLLSRGDRRLSKVIERAWQLGAKFDAWDEHFNFDYWLKAVQECNIDIDFYLTRRKELNEVLPWDYIDTGVDKDYLKNQLQKTLTQF